MIDARFGGFPLLAGTLSLFAAVLSQAASPDINQLCAKLAGHEFGQDRSAVTALEEMLRTGDVQTRSLIENGLVTVLQNPQSTAAGRNYACRFLRGYGSELAVPALERLLTDAKSAQIAVFALDGIPGGQAAVALRSSLGRAAPEARAAALTALGRRRDAASVLLAVRSVTDAEHAVAVAALFALGEIGTVASAEALLGMTVPAAVQTDWQDACFRCAELLRNAPESSSATAVYRRLSAAGMPPHVRAEALGGLADLGSPGAVDALVQMLRSADLSQQQSAAAVLPQLSGAAAVDSLITQLPQLQPAAQVAVVHAITSKKNAAALPALRRMLEGAEGDLLGVIVEGIGKLGDATDVPALAAVAGPRGDVGKAAASALVALTKDGVEDALLRSAEAGESSARVAAIHALAARGAAAAVPAFVKLAADDDSGVRRAAVKALGELAGGGELAALADVLVSPRDPADGAQLVRVVTTVAQRVNPTSQAIDVLLAKRKGADEQGIAAVTRVMGRLGGDAALSVVRSELAEGPVRRDGAVRALGDWPSAAPLDDLEELARSSRPDVERVLALRGYLRLLGLPSERSQAETVAKLKMAMSLSRSAGERKLVLGQIGGMNDGAGLELAAPLMADPDVGEEAAATVLRLLGSLGTGTLKLQRPVLEAISASAHKDASHKAKDLLTALDSPVYEAEDAKRTHGSADRNHAGFTGTGFVNFDSVPDGTIEWSIGVEKQGRYALEFRYALGAANRPLDIAVDGKTIAKKQAFHGTGGWTTWKTVQLTTSLGRGEHIVRAVTSGRDGPNLDSLKVSRVGE